MTKSDFLKLFAEKLQLADENLTSETKLASLNEWDSWARLDIMSMVDETFQVILTAEDLSKLETPEDLIKIIGDHKFD